MTDCPSSIWSVWQTEDEVFLAPECEAVFYKSMAELCLQTGQDRVCLSVLAPSWAKIAFW